MPAALAVPAFAVGTIVSLLTSLVLVTRLERVGERLGLSEALLGMVAALAADAPEVTSALTAVARHEQRIGAGVILGSNVFNLAALLGLGAVVAGRIGLHRKAVVLGGTVAMWVAAVCLAVVLGWLPPVAGLVLALAVLIAYAVFLGTEGRGPERLRIPARWSAWLRSAVAEEELELEEAIRPRRGRWPDAVAAVVALIVVVAASVIMERAASVLGSRWAVPQIVVGGLVLAAVTSLPNAVAAVYLAARGRGAATFSTALNSNTLNVAAGLLLPAAVIGLGGPSGQAVLVTVWYVGLSLAVLALAYTGRGLRRGPGALVIAAYAAFTVSVLASGYAAASSTTLITAFGIGTALALALAVGRAHFRRENVPETGQAPSFPRDRAADYLAPGNPASPPGSAHHSANGCSPASVTPVSLRNRESLLPGRSVGRIWAFSLAASALIASVDAAIGHVTLIGLLVIGPCSALFTGRWVPTALTGLWVTALAVVLGLPDGIWATTTHLAFLAAVALAAVAATVAAAVINQARNEQQRHP